MPEPHWLAYFLDGPASGSQPLALPGTPPPTYRVATAPSSPVRYAAADLDAPPSSFDVEYGIVTYALVFRSKERRVALYQQQRPSRG